VYDVFKRYWQIKVESKKINWKNEKKYYFIAFYLITEILILQKRVKIGLIFEITVFVACFS